MQLHNALSANPSSDELRAQLLAAGQVLLYAIPLHLPIDLYTANLTPFPSFPPFPPYVWGRRLFCPSFPRWKGGRRCAFGSSAQSSVGGAGPGPSK